MQRLRWLGTTLLAVAMTLSTVIVGFAAPAPVDPFYETVDEFNQSGAATNMFPNRNQLFIRLTGRSYEERIGSNLAHWNGSLMGFVEDLVNDKVINGSSETTVGTQYKLFQNYLDLIVKRLLDQDATTPLDYDTQTFRYVDLYNPAITDLSHISAASSITDMNGDGDSESWERSEILRETCLNLPILGDVCLNLFVVSLGASKVRNDGSIELVDPVRPTIAAPWNPAVQVQNPGGRFLDFADFVTSDPRNSTHMFLTSFPNRSFDLELNNCDQAEDLALIVDCDDSPYRDDDDGLFLEIGLKDFKMDLLAQPPVTTTVTQDVSHAGIDYQTDIGAGAFPRNITDLADGEPLGYFASSPVAAGGGGVTRAISLDDPLEQIPGCPQYAAGDPYQAACDLSNYLKATIRVDVPELTVAASLRILSSYSDFPDGVTEDTINLGIVAQSIDLGLDFALAMSEGPYCVQQDPTVASVGVGIADGVGVGQDGVGVYYANSDNPNNCALPADGDGVINISDDATYLISAKISDIIPHVRAELQVFMEDLFNPNENPGRFIGPTRLLDVNETISGISFDWPLNATSATDYVTLELVLDSSVDDSETASQIEDYSTRGAAAFRGDNFDEFFADWNGVSLPMNAGIGLGWYQDENLTTPMASCVVDEGAFTGYVDGYANTGTDLAAEDADNPHLSRPLPRLKTRFTGYRANGTWDDGVSMSDGATGKRYDADMLGQKIPDVNGVAPFAGPRINQDSGNPQAIPINESLDYTPGNEDPDATYALGIALHQNMLSKALYELVIDGLLCIELDPRNPDSPIDLGSILNTDLWGFFIPYLADNFPDSDMAIRVIPTVQNPNRVYEADGSLAAGSDSYASQLSEFVNAYASSAVTQENAVPRIITGGLNVYDVLKDRYVGAITTQNALDVYNNPLTADAALTNPVSLASAYGLWPDLSIIIPHLVIEFYVWDESGATAVKRRAFAMDVGLNVGLNIDVVKDPGVPNSGALALDGVTATNSLYQFPRYNGTDFPVGCGPNTAYACEITGVDSRLVLFLGGLLDPELNSILVYDEMSSVVTDQELFLNNGATDYTLYENAISNLLGMVLSAEIGFLGEIGFDPAAFLNIPIIFSAPYVGPSFVANRYDGAADVDPETEVQHNADGDLSCGAGGDDVCPDPLGADPASGWRDVSDNDLNGFGDYLIISAGLDLSALTSDYLFRLIDSFVEPLLNSECETAGVTCQTELYQTSLNNLLGAPSVAASQQDSFRLPNGYVSPKTYIKGIEKAHAEETVISFEGTHPEGDSLTYAWRVDGGLWTPYLDWTKVRIPGLLEGRHVFEVKAKDSQNRVEYAPARIEFNVDSVAPRITIEGDRTQDLETDFVASVFDAQTASENVRVSYRVDGGEWSRYSFDKSIVASLEEGRHTLEVRAIDEAGNVSNVESLSFNTQDSGFGCATSTSGNPMELIVLLLGVGVFVLRRRVAA
jgi:hypothetical protein